MYMSVAYEAYIKALAKGTELYLKVVILSKIVQCSCTHIYRF